MFSLNRKTDYALVALARLASLETESGGSGSSGSGETEPLSARAISEEFDLPLQGLMGILKELHRAGLVDSIRGAKGGYTLASDPRSISVADVIHAIEGPTQLAPCCDEGEVEDGDECVTCRLIARCPISSAIRDLSGRITGYLNTVTIAQLLESEHGTPLPKLEGGGGKEGTEGRGGRGGKESDGDGERGRPVPVQVNVKIER